MYQQKTGITTVVKTFLPETRLVGRFYPAVAAPPVSHHLNQQLPVSLFSHSQSKLVSLLEADTWYCPKFYRLETYRITFIRYPQDWALHRKMWWILSDAQIYYIRLNLFVNIFIIK